MFLVINIALVHTETNINAKKPFYRTATLSNHIFLDIELVKIFDRSLIENVPYLVELDGVSYEGWIKRQRRYWETEKGLSITYHAKTNSVWIVPMNSSF